MPFQVFDNGKPADCHHHTVSSSLNCSVFSTYEEARAYAESWLGEIFHSTDLQLNTPYDYSGYGDLIEIREVP